MTFLLGRQAMLGQEPPRYLRSIVATRCPCSPNVQARNFDPVPLPRMINFNAIHVNSPHWVDGLDRPKYSVFAALSNLGHAAIDKELDSGDVARFIGCEERDRFGDIV
jgi:hypothetical protein